VAHRRPEPVAREEREKGARERLGAMGPAGVAAEECAADGLLKRIARARRAVKGG